MVRQLSGKWLALVLALIALAVGPALAQETTAGIQGTVRDATGGTVAGATVEVTGPALIGIRKVTTDDAGAYRPPVRQENPYEEGSTRPYRFAPAQADCRHDRASAAARLS